VPNLDAEVESHVISSLHQDWTCVWLGIIIHYICTEIEDHQPTGDCAETRWRVLVSYKSSAELDIELAGDIVLWVALHFVWKARATSKPCVGVTVLRTWRVSRRRQRSPLPQFLHNITKIPEIPQPSTIPLKTHERIREVRIAYAVPLSAHQDQQSPSLKAKKATSIETSYARGSTDDASWIDRWMDR